MEDRDQGVGSAAQLLERYGPGSARAGRPTWVRMWERPDGGRCVTAESSGIGPLGWTAPPGCRAVAVVATGRLRRLGDSVELSPPPAAGEGGLSVACVVDRESRVDSLVVLHDGTVFDQPPEEGRLLDVLRRTLRLPTSPPSVPVEVIHTAVWLQLLAEVAAVMDGRCRLSWSEAAALHPLLRSGARPATVAASDLVACGGRLGTWELLRRTVAAGEKTYFGTDPEVAAWMDDGMFSRWVTGILRPPEALLERVRPHLTAPAARRVSHVVWMTSTPSGAPGRSRR